MLHCSTNVTDVDIRAPSHAFAGFAAAVATTNIEIQGGGGNGKCPFGCEGGQCPSPPGVLTCTAAALQARNSGSEENIFLLPSERGLELRFYIVLA